jgi:hypothetical protein
MNNDYELYKLKAELCKTFADAKRLMIISELRHGEKAVGNLVQALQYRLANLKIIDACDIIHEILLEQVAKNREIAEKLIP